MRIGTVKQMKKNINYRFISNLMLLIPFVNSLYWHYYWYAIIVATTFFVSAIYHWSREEKFEKADEVFANVLIATNLYLIYLGHFRPARIVVIAIFLGFFSTVMFVKQNYKNYPLTHNIYHILSAIICILCLIIYKY